MSPVNSMFYMDIMGLDVSVRVTSKLNTEGDDEIRDLHTN